MSNSLTERDRIAFLAAKKVQLLRLMIRQLESITAADVATLPPHEQAHFAATLDRLPDEVPAQMIARLRAALSEPSAVA